MKKAFAVMFLVLSLCGCKAQPEPAKTTQPSLDDMVIDNANTVRAAALAFEAQNGQFPNEVNELQPFLPGGELLVNPYVGAATEPVDGAAALSGQIGYQPVYAQSGSVHGYHITGFGETEEIVHLFFDPAGP